MVVAFTIINDIYDIELKNKREEKAEDINIYLDKVMMNTYIAIHSYLKNIESEADLE
jgi:hypothetical protein